MFDSDTLIAECLEAVRGPEVLKCGLSAHFRNKTSVSMVEAHALGLDDDQKRGLRCLVLDRCGALGAKAGDRRN